MTVPPPYVRQRQSHLFFISVLLLILLALREAPVRAAVVDDCSQESLVFALEEGGYVTFDVSCSLTLTNTVTVRNTAVLDGAGFTNTISGGNAWRLFIVEAGGNLSLWNLKLTGGRAASGGAIYVKPGGQLTLSNCVLQANSAVGANGLAGSTGEDSDGIGGNGGTGTPGLPGLGGAIYSGGDVRAYSCQFMTNSATGGDGGVGGDGGDGRFAGGNGGDGAGGAVAMGGAIYNGNRLWLRDCYFEGNSLKGGHGAAGGAGGDGPFNGFAGSGGSAGAVFGAAVYSSASATVLSCTFSSNSATAGKGAAGGTLSNGNGSAGTSGGEAAGGAICLSGLGAVTNSTFYKNRLTAGNGANGGPGDFNAGNGGNGGNSSGGAIFNLGTTYMVNCTVAENTAIAGTNGVSGSGPFDGQDGTPGLASGAGVASSLGSVFLENTILSGNTPGGNLYGVILDRGYNISSDLSMLLPAGSSRAATNPRLGAFGNNGGPTKTIVLLTNSPAIDKIPSSRSPAFDQRGVPRPVNALSDIGSVERGYAVSGRVTFGTDGLAGVLISSEGGSTTTSTGGGYTLFAGETNITLVPILAGYEFSPSNHALTVSGNVSNINFTATLLFSLGGQVTDGTNGLSGVQLAATTSALTNTVFSTNGLYLFSGLRSNLYTVTPMLTGYLFEPSARAILVNSNTNGVNFSGMPVVGLERQTNGVIQIDFTGVSGLPYRVDASSNLTLWVPIATNPAPFLFTDPSASNAPIRFYRVSPF